MRRLFLARYIFAISFIFIFMIYGNAFADGKYMILPGEHYNFDGEKVEVVEFMSFYCSHCYALEKWIPVVLGNFPHRVRWKVVPIYWGKGSSKPGEAYLIAKHMGKGDEMKKAIFKARFEEHRNISDMRVIEEIAARIGLDFRFSLKLRGGEEAGEAKEGLLLADKYGIKATPTLLIAGNMLTDPTMSGEGIERFARNVISILGGIYRSSE